MPAQGRGGGRSGNFVQPLAAAWRGELRLWVSYWLLGVGGNSGFVAAMGLPGLLGGEAALSYLWALYLLSLAWFIFVFVAIWRSAADYRGPHVWAVFARAGIIGGALRMAVEPVLLASLGTR